MAAGNLKWSQDQVQGMLDDGQEKVVQRICKGLIVK